MNKEALYSEIEKYSQKYELSFQFWGKGNMNVFISKGGVDLTSFGGRDTIKEILIDTLEWLYRVNKVPKEKQYTAEINELIKDEELVDMFDSVVVYGIGLSEQQKKKCAQVAKQYASQANNLK